MDLIRTITPHVSGISEHLGGSGDPSPATALGRAVGDEGGRRAPLGRRRRWRAATSCINGVGKVGGALADHLHAEGARLTVADVRPGRGRRGRRAHRRGRGGPGRRPRGARATSTRPARSAARLSAATIPELRTAAVVGWPTTSSPRRRMPSGSHDAGVLYAPDYVVNAGGVINIAEEKGGYDRARAEERIRGIHDTVLRVLDLAAARGHHHRGGRRPAGRAADRRGTDAGERRTSEHRPTRAGGDDADLDQPVAVTETQPAARRTGGPVPTADDLSVLHLHDRHTELGLTRRGPGRACTAPSSPPGCSTRRSGASTGWARRPSSCRARATRARRSARRGRCAPGTTSCCPTTATPA